MAIPSDVVLGDRPLGIEDVVGVARFGATVGIAESAVARVRSSREVLERLIDSGEAIYGVTTGFGALSTTPLGRNAQLELQPRILRSHAAGTGRPLSDDVVRAALLLRANMLAHGFSGVRLIVIERLVELLNVHITPIVPEQGSVGASGDLAPLAHLSLPLIGEGSVRTRDGVRPSAEALRAAALEPIQLEAKEASSLTNGTEVSLALATLAIADAEALLDAAEIAAAMSFVAMRGHLDAFDERIHALRPHPGQTATARRMRELLQPSDGSDPTPARRPVHDVYSLRCIPQVFGAAREALSHVRSIVEIELDSVTDNPLCFADTATVLSGGNFHGHPLSVACDYLKIAVASIATFAERRIASLLDSRASGLPDLLTPQPAENSGFMLVQYVAASLASENKTLAHPASVDSITTAAGAEDYNSMSATAARHLRDVVANTRRVVAMELLCAAQGMDLAGIPDIPAAVAAHNAIRARVPMLRNDTDVVSDLISAVDALIESGNLRRDVGEASASGPRRSTKAE